MGLGTRIKHLRGVGKSLLAAGLMLLFAASTVASGCSHLHEKLHSDHASPTHACLISTLDHGLGSGAFEGPALVVRPETPSFSELPPPFSWVSVELRQFSGRGPPCLS